VVSQAYEGWIREENTEPFLRLYAEATRAPELLAEIPAVLDALLDTDPARGRWWSSDPLPGPVRLRLGREPGTGVVELQLTPRDWGADAVVERVRVLCTVMQAWSLVRAT